MSDEELRRSSLRRACVARSRVVGRVQKVHGAAVEYGYGLATAGGIVQAARKPTARLGGADTRLVVGTCVGALPGGGMGRGDHGWSLRRGFDRVIIWAWDG